MTTFKKLPTDAPISSPRTQVQSGKMPRSPSADSPIGRRLLGRVAAERIEFGGHADAAKPYAPPPSPADRDSMTFANGKNIEMTMNPTMNPSMTIMIGSRAAVSEASVASISAS